MLLPIEDARASGAGYFAVAITPVEDRSHAGMLYIDRAGALRLLHLAWNFQLSDQPPSDRYRWAVAGLPESLRKYLAVICDRIATAQPQVPYGFDSSGIVIDRETGNLIPGPEGKGYTCSSFILAVLKSVDLQLLVEEEWPTDANLKWQQWILAMLDETEAPPSQIEAVKKDVGSRRFTPEEVIGASTLRDWPVGYATAAELAVTVKAELRA